jgi:hypothetical protein
MKRRTRSKKQWQVACFESCWALKLIKIQAQLEDEKKTLQREFNQWKALPDKIGLFERHVDTCSKTDVQSRYFEVELTEHVEGFEGNKAKALGL